MLEFFNQFTGIASVVGTLLLIVYAFFYIIQRYVRLEEKVDNQRRQIDALNGQIGELLRKEKKK